MGKAQTPRTDLETIRFYLEEYHPGTGIRHAFFIEKSRIIKICNRILNKTSNIHQGSFEAATKLMQYVNNLDRKQISSKIIRNPKAYKVSHEPNTIQIF